jgi:hypothetical protein
MRDSAVKDRGRMLNGMAEKVAQTERKLEQIENDLRRIRIECAAEKKRHESSKVELTRLKNQVVLVKGNLQEFEGFATKVEQCAKTELLRANGKTEVANNNRRNKQIVSYFCNARNLS